MRRQLPARTIAVALLCLIVVTTFVVAQQTLPRTTSGNTNASPTPVPVATPTPTPQGSAPVAMRRNLAQYASLAPLSLPDNATPAARRQLMGQVRSFVWSKWQSKERARASYVSTLMRGFAPGTTSYYVEPDEQGRWRVAIEVQGQDYPQYFYEVEEVAVDEHGLPLEAHELKQGVRAAGRGLHLKPGKGGGIEGLVF